MKQRGGREIGSCLVIMNIFKKNFHLKAEKISAGEKIGNFPFIMKKEIIKIKSRKFFLK